MKPNELRIGNWVHNEITGKDMQVYPMMIPQMEHTKPKYDNGIISIPLTEEWLKKFGFTFDDNFKISYLSPDVNNWQMRIFTSSNGYEWVISIMHKIEIKYVHQLQNLYFALTGEELKII
jgi:hypothetical protein